MSWASSVVGALALMVFMIFRHRFLELGIKVYSSDTASSPAHNNLGYARNYSLRHKFEV